MGEKLVRLSLAIASYKTGALTAEQYVRMRAKTYGVSPAMAAEMVRMESDYDTHAVGDDGKAVGWWQFHWDTWLWACRLTGLTEYARLDGDGRLDEVVSTEVALILIARGWGKLWTSWRLLNG